MYVCVYVYVYIYIYTHMNRERERDTYSVREVALPMTACGTGPCQGTSAGTAQAACPNQ